MRSLKASLRPCAQSSLITKCMRPTTPRCSPSATTSTTSTTSNEGIRSSATSTPSNSNCVPVPFDEWHSQPVHGSGGSSVGKRARCDVRPFEEGISKHGNAEPNNFCPAELTAAAHREVFPSVFQEARASIEDLKHV